MFKKKKKEKGKDSLSWEETWGPFRPHSSWYYIDTVEHWFSQCCDSCSCLADICFHPFTLFGCVCSEGSSGSCLIKWMLFKKNIDACYCRFIMDQWRDSLSQKSLLPACLFFALCPRIVSQLCLWFVVLVILLFPKGFIWRSLCTAIKWYIYNKCKPLRKWCNT